MYLVAYSNYPFTAADIRRDIGLASTAFDGVIEDAIARAASLERKPIRAQVWAISERSKPFGTPVSVGPLYERPNDQWLGSHMFRDCAYEADPEAVETARKMVADWCLRQDDICMALGAEARRAMCAPVALREVA
jgi:hypothetical protein